MATPTTTIQSLRARLADLGREVGGFGPRSVPEPLRRDHILTAATLAFVTDGFDGASMQRIAESAGVTKPVVYSLFASKEELFAAVIDRESGEIASRVGLALADEGESPLRAGIVAFLRYEEERGDIWGPVLGSVQYRPVADAALRLRETQVSMIASSIGRGYAARDIAADPREIEGLAHLVMGACGSVANWWREHPEMSLDAIADFLEVALGASLEAVRTGRGAAGSFGSSTP